MMFIHTWKKVLDGSKSQTRRIRFPYELAVQLWKHGWDLPWNYAWSSDQQQALIEPRYIRSANKILKKNHVTIPIIPGRWQKAVGRIYVTEIRREQLQDISEEDAIAEGMFKEGYPMALRPVTRFMHLWNSINKKPGTRWHDNPGVFTLSFESVAKNV